MRSIAHLTVNKILRVSAWVRCGRKYDAPVRPDRVIWCDPSRIEHKSASSPETDRIPPTVIVGGEWDRELSPITDDIVYKAFYKRFVEERDWNSTGYVSFLTTDVSEHGECTVEEANARCKKLDELYSYIDQHGYKTQRELHETGELVSGLNVQNIRPPEYREVSVDVTRDGEFVWHGGMHRLVIAKLLDLDAIPVRINIRHKKWQERRERAYRAGDSDFEDHPDIKIS